MAEGIITKETLYLVSARRPFTCERGRRLTDTLAMNVLAEIMTTKQTEAKDLPVGPPAVNSDSAAKAPQKEARPSQASTAAVRKTGRAHRPGLGIYRSPLLAPKAEPHNERQT